MNKFPTSREILAVSLAFATLGESRYNRSYEEYVDIATRLPPPKVLHADINKLLREMHKAGDALDKICHFKAGDGYIWYEKFPSSLSLKTLLNGLTKVGMRQPLSRRRR
jgi:hypothetical protein